MPIRSQATLPRCARQIGPDGTVVTAALKFPSAGQYELFNPRWVMAGLVPAIHDFSLLASKTWMPGT